MTQVRRQASEPTPFERCDTEAGWKSDSTKWSVHTAKLEPAKRSASLQLRQARNDQVDRIRSATYYRYFLTPRKENSFLHTV